MGEKWLRCGYFVKLKLLAPSEGNRSWPANIELENIANIATIENESITNIEHENMANIEHENDKNKDLLSCHVMQHRFIRHVGQH